MAFDANTNRCGMWMIYTSSTGSPNKKDVAAASGISIDTGVANQISFTGEGNARIVMLNASGTANI